MKRIVTSVLVCYQELRACDSGDLKELVEDLMRENEPDDFCGRPQDQENGSDQDNHEDDENAVEVTALSKLPEEDDEQQIEKYCDDIGRVIDKHSWIYPQGPRGLFEPRLDLDPIHSAHVAECIRQRDILQKNKLWDDRLDSAWRTLWLSPEKHIDIINSILVMLGKNFLLERRKDGEDRKAMLMCFTEIPTKLRTLIDAAIARRIQEREQQERDELNARREERGRLSLEKLISW